MAEHTDQNLLHQVIYSVFVRNHTKEGTFRALEGDLDRLKGLGADIIWLMPIHPIGSEGRKGTLGSPYAIQDYRGINPEYGTREDFIHLVDAIHARGMKCIIDVVYNHTSPDSVLAHTHPEYFLRDAEGRPTRKGGGLVGCGGPGLQQPRPVELPDRHIEAVGRHRGMASAATWPAASRWTSGVRHAARWRRCALAASGWPKASTVPTCWACAARARPAPRTPSCTAPST